MKRIFCVLIVIVLFFDFSFAQGNLDFSNYSSIKELKKEAEDFTNGLHAGMNTLTWTDASTSSIAGVNLSVFTGFGGAKKNTNVGINKDFFTLSTMGLQAGLSTAGFEIMARYSPEFTFGDYKANTLGFGLKYEISDLFPAPGLPSTAIYVDYNSQNFTVNHIKLDLSSVNTGLMASYDLIVIGVYAKLGMEFGKSKITWNTPAGEVSGDISGSGFRYAIGLTVFGIRAELGGRGSNTSLGLGYGLGFSL